MFFYYNMQASESCQLIISADGLGVCVQLLQMEDLMDSLASHYTGQEKEETGSYIVSFTS